MGQKVNPHGLRVGVIKDWDSKWYANSKDFSVKIRKYLFSNFFRPFLHFLLTIFVHFYIMEGYSKMGVLP